MNWAIPHSAAVHLPIALGLLMPAFAGSAVVATKVRWMPHGIWTVLALLGLIQCGVLALAWFTGARAGFLSAANTALIERHEHAALALVGLWALATVLLGVIAWRPALSRVWYAAVLLVLFVQMALTVATGHLGGQLLP